MIRYFLWIVIFLITGLWLPAPADACLRLRHCHCEKTCHCSADCTCGCQVNKQAKSKIVGSKGFWPFTDGEVDPPAPPDEPLPAPSPDAPPAPDPSPLPPTPAPAPETPVVIPTDHAELNKFVAGKLGGFARANYVRNGLAVDIYQKRGKQSISWVVANGDCWQTAFVAAFIAKATTESNKAGIVLVCHCTDDPVPTPEPVPVNPAPVPVNPDVFPEPVIDTPVQKRLYKSGGQELVTAEAVCRAAGLWLCVVHDKTGEVNRVIYGTVTPQKVQWKSKAKAKK